MTDEKCYDCFAYKQDTVYGDMCITPKCIKEYNYDPETKSWIKKEMKSTNQADEIVLRNKGNIDDLVCHINKEIHISAIIHKRIGDGIYKCFLQVKLEQLHQLKVDLQQSLIKYKEKTN